MKRVLKVFDPPAPHWVGDGFPVRSLLSYQQNAEALSPFLLLDHAGPAKFAPSETRRGVGEHPHRGFETVTLVFQGEVDHRDSSGAGGHIGPGDVQWMTAARGVVHDEFHSDAFTRAGGTLEMVQLWVNLPARHKMGAPRYQAITTADIPRVALADGAGSLRVIAGEFQGQRGPAQTFTPINLWDIALNAGAALPLTLPAGHTLALAVLHGRARINRDTPAKAGQLVLLDRDGVDAHIEASEDARVLLLGGEPIPEPVVGYGPFVMNTQAEIQQALRDFHRGAFGSLPG